MLNMTLIKRARPNGYPVEMFSTVDSEGQTWFYVFLPNDDPNYPPDPFEFDNETDALAFYKREVKAYAQTPNWDAQADYDAQWGEPIYTHRASEY